LINKKDFLRIFEKKGNNYKNRGPGLRLFGNFSRPIRLFLSVCKFFFAAWKIIKYKIIRLKLNWTEGKGEIFFKDKKNFFWSMLLDKGVFKDRKRFY